MRTFNEWMESVNPKRCSPAEARDMILASIGSPREGGSKNGYYIGLNERDLTVVVPILHIDGNYDGYDVGRMVTHANHFIDPVSGERGYIEGKDKLVEVSARYDSMEAARKAAIAYLIDDLMMKRVAPARIFERIMDTELKLPFDPKECYEQWSRSDD